MSEEAPFVSFVFSFRIEGSRATTMHVYLPTLFILCECLRALHVVGHHDGIFQHKRYFQTAPRHAVFVRAQELLYMRKRNELVYV